VSMTDRRTISAGGDFRGEAGLSLLPLRGAPAAEVGIFADGMVGIDAWGAAALKTSVEYYARYQQQQVSMSAPSRAPVWRVLYHLLASDCPRHFVPTDDAQLPAAQRPSAVLLPAVRVPSIDAAEGIAEVLLGRASGRLTRAVRFVAEELPELVDNSIRHARRSPTAPVACCFYDAEEDELQLVVCDLGSGFDRDESAGESLLAAVDAQPRGGLRSAAEVAASRGLDATLTVAAGNGRVYWRSGSWSAAAAVAVSGVAAAVAIQIATSR
jgi:hypothetical protein